MDAIVLRCLSLPPSIRGKKEYLLVWSIPPKTSYRAALQELAREFR